LAKHYKFDLEIPFARLPKKIQNILLYGSSEAIRFHYQDEDGYSFTKTNVFEGIIANFERRYRETESEYVRDELSKYISVKICEICNGTRLNKAAQHVFIADKNLPEIASWPVDKTKVFFENLHLPGFRGEIAAKVIKELISRLSFLVDVGLNYLSLDRSAETL